MAKRTPSAGLGSLGSGAVTALALAVQTGLAAVVGVVLAREFGRGPVTDGFFAAYGVFIVIVLAGNAIRITVLPAFGRARVAGRLAGEVASYVLVLASLALPLLVAGAVAAGPLADLLTGGRGGLAQATAADLLPLMLLAAGCQLAAGIAASALAALDDYVVAAAGFALGSVAGLVLILARVHADGVMALGYGIALNGGLALAIPLAALALRARRASLPRGAVRPAGASFASRLATMGAGVALPLALQAIYVVSLPIAAREGAGAVTSLGFAYLIASAIVSVAASSLALVTAVPLARAGLDPERAARHVVGAAWIALVAIGAAAGVFALAGAPIAHLVLGGSYGSAAGAELGRLVVLLSPWAVASVGISVAFPLVFVAGRSRSLPLVGAAAVALQLVAARAGQAWLGLDGLAAALAVTTGAVLAVLLLELGALRPGARGLAEAVAAVAAGAALAFVPPGLLLPGPVAAAAGLLAYAVLVAAVRPAGLGEAWRYLRTLS